MINEVLTGLDQWKGRMVRCVRPQLRWRQSAAALTWIARLWGIVMAATLKPIATAKLTARNEINISDPPFSSYMQCVSAGFGSRCSW
jgi:hypothetical protein